MQGRRDILMEEGRNIGIYPTTYREVRIGRTLYCVTSVFTGETDLTATLERLAVQRVLADMETEAASALRNC